MKVAFTALVNAALINSALIEPALLQTMMLCVVRARFVVVVVDHSLLDGPLKSATHHSAAHSKTARTDAGATPAITGMSKATDAVQNSFDTFKRQRARSHSCCRLHCSTQKAWRPRLHRPILR